MHRLVSVAAVVGLGLVAAGCANGDVGVYPFCVNVPGADDGAQCKRLPPGPTTTIPRVPETPTTTTAQPSYSLSAAPASNQVVAGGAATYTVTIGRTNFNGPIDLSVSGLPPRSTGTFDPDPAEGTSSTLTISTARNTPRGSVTLTITGTHGSMTRSTTVTLTVTKS